MLLLALFALGACGDDDLAAPTAGGIVGDGRGRVVSIATSISDQGLQLERASAPSGNAWTMLVFAVHNESASTQSFVVLRTDLPLDDLPVTSGRVDEAGLGVSLVDRLDDVRPGELQSLNVIVGPGRYVALANGPGAYAAGLRAVFSVEATPAPSGG